MRNTISFSALRQEAAGRTVAAAVLPRGAEEQAAAEARERARAEARRAVEAAAAEAGPPKPNIGPRPRRST